MYRIDESKNKEKYKLIVPATLDAHFPLIKYMFWSKKYWVHILDESKGILDLGLRYGNNEMCYPFVIMVGQVVQHLRSQSEDIGMTRLLIPTAGDACRGACYIGMFRKSLERAGLDACKVVTLNVRHVEEDINMEMGLGMAIRGLLGMYYGDILMLLADQVRPYELEKGATDNLRQLWTERLAEDLKAGRHLTWGSMKRNFRKICEDFAAIPKSDVKKQRIGIVGEFYTKYCSLGNWDLVPYLEENGCETHTNGLSWYALYYIDTHMPEKKNLEWVAFRMVRGIISRAQRDMVETLREYGFYTLPSIDELKEDALPYVSQNLEVGDGWLMGTEVVGYIKNDCRKIICVAPFGCMPNACAGRGLYPFIQRTFPEAAVTTVETDASGSTNNYFNRVQMLINC